jgi:hypothetical protein
MASASVAVPGSEVIASRVRNSREVRRVSFFIVGLSLKVGLPNTVADLKSMDLGT